MKKIYIIIYLLLSINILNAKIINVINVANTNDNGAGSLRQAIMDATDGTTINIPFAGPITLTSELPYITIQVTINGYSGGTIISGNNACRIFTVQIPTGTVTFNNLMIQNGASTNGAASGLFAITGNNGLVVLNRCTFSGCNTTGSQAYGGAIATSADINMTNCTVYGNTAQLSGGALATISNCTVNILNCTIYKNHSTNGVGTGGIDVYGNATVNIQNSILAGNDAGTTPTNSDVLTSNGGTLNSNGNNLSNTSPFSQPSDLINQTNILLSNLAQDASGFWVCALQNGSVAINNANNTAAPSTDECGNSRIDIADIGAFENQTLSFVVSPTTRSIASLANSTATFTIFSLSDWTVTSNQTWITADAISGTGNATITLTVQANPSPSTRQAIITVNSGTANKTVTVTQDAAPVVLSISTSTASVGTFANSTVTFDISSNSNWTLSSNQTWLTASVLSGSGNLTITLTAQANSTSATRQATVTVSASGAQDKTVTVTQDAPPLATQASTISTNGFTANWNITSGATGYYLDVSTDPGFGAGTFVNNNGNGNEDVGNNLMKIVSSLIPGATYYYQVRAYNSGGTSGNSNSITVTTSKVNQTITFSAINPVNYGVAPFSISASGGASGNPVIFTSSDNNIATCTGTNGTTITIVGSGNCTIYANQAGNASYNAAPQVNQSLTVNKATPTIMWLNPSDIVYGTALSATQLNATASIQGTFVYSPALNTTLNAGTGQTLSVTFTPNDGADYTTATANVLINVSKAMPAITWSNPSDIAYGTALSATQLNASCTVNGALTYSPAANSVLNAGNGQTLNVSFISSDANYTNATASVLLNVTKVTLSVIADNISKMYLDAIPTLTYYLSGLVNGDLSAVISGTPALSTTAIQSSNLGTYPISISLGSMTSSNYIFNFVNSTLTIIPITTIWNGTSWSHGIPIAGAIVNINAPYTVGVNIPGTSLSLQDLTVASNVTLYVKQGFSLTVNGNFINNGGIVLQGDATSTPTGSFICYGTESGTGTYTAQRNITSSGIQHYVSSPMPNQTNAVFAPYYSFNTGNGTTWTTYTGILANMTGYAVQYSVNTKMNTFTGTSPFNSGNQQINVNGASAMFLAGNPYPSAIDWVKVAGLTQTNITNTFYIRDVGRNVTCNTTTCAGGVFATDRFIPAMKGFLIKTGTATLGTFKMDNTVLTNATTAYWKDENALSNIVRLKTTGGNYQGDEAVVYFDEFASKGIDNNDGDKLFEEESYYSHLFTLTEDNHPLAINVTPAVKTMPLVFQCGVAGSYSIEASELKFENGNTVFLEDLQNGNIVNLSNGAYNFAYTNTSNPYNFILHFAATSSIKPNVAGSINVYANKNMLYVQNTYGNYAEVVVYNTLGREVRRLTITGNYNTIEMNVVPGAYMVKVISGSNVVTKKVLIN